MSPAETAPPRRRMTVEAEGWTRLRVLEPPAGRLPVALEVAGVAPEDPWAGADQAAPRAGPAARWAGLAAATRARGPAVKLETGASTPTTVEERTRAHARM